MNWSPTQAGGRAFAHDFVEHSAKLLILQQQLDDCHWIFAAGFNRRSARLLDYSDQAWLMFSKYLLVPGSRPQATEAVGAARLITSEHYQAATMKLQRAVHSAQRPSDAEGNQSARVRLGPVRHPSLLPAYENCT